MKTKIITAAFADEKILLPAANMLKRGGLVAFPTETVYGLGANGLDPAAAAGIYRAKGRPSDNPLILHIADFKMLDFIADEVNSAARTMMRAFWPGPVTFILQRKPVVPDAATGGLDTVGVRMPDHEIARALIRLAETPLAAPSANTSGRPSPTTADAVLADLDGKIDAVIDGGPCRCGIESTIVDCTGSLPTILRPGAVTARMLADVAGEIEVGAALKEGSAAPKAPGMKYAHYAPRAEMILLVGAAERMADAMVKEIRRARAAGRIVGAIVSAETAATLPRDVDSAVYGRRGDLSRIAANVYGCLRHFDRGNVDLIFCEGAPETGVGIAVMNRLRKASGYRIIEL